MLVLGCSGAKPEPAPVPEWQAVFEDLPGALLRVFGQDGVVYAIGADGDGRGPLVLRFDGASWRRLATGATGDLWWGTVLGADRVRMVGEAGLVVDYVPSADRFEILPKPTDSTLFGVWGASENDVWYVGGLPALSSGVILRGDSVSTRPFEPQPTETSSATMFKAHGFSSSDVFVVGQRGTALRFDGQRFAPTEVEPKLPLISVHGTAPDALYAVGGGASGLIVRYDGEKWADETPTETPQLSGVWAVDRETAFAAGFNGRIYRRSAGVWSEEAGPIPTYEDLHGVYVDPEGAIWAVGGRLATDPPTKGVLVRYGAPISSETEN